jgi:hypothetical protein
MRELHVTSPMMSGQDVVDLQVRLQYLGYSPGPADGYYGPTTAAALAEFQHSVDPDGKLAVPGSLTDALWTQLQLPQSSSGIRAGSALGLLALAEAKKHLGLREDPSGSNQTPFGVWFGRDGVRWCAIFVSYCFAVGAQYVLCQGSKGAGVVAGKGCAYVPTIEAWLRSAGFWVGRTEPQPGDIAIFNWDGRGAEHVGLVDSYLGGPHGQFNTVEGNTAVGNDSNGGQVASRLRHLSQVDGFGRIT